MTIKSFLFNIYAIYLRKSAAITHHIHSILHKSDASAAKPLYIYEIDDNYNLILVDIY